DGVEAAFLHGAEELRPLTGGDHPQRRTGIEGGAQRDPAVGEAGGLDAVADAAVLPSYELEFALRTTQRSTPPSYDRVIVQGQSVIHRLTDLGSAGGAGDPSTTRRRCRRPPAGSSAARDPRGPASTPCRAGRSGRARRPVSPAGRPRPGPRRR